MDESCIVGEDYKLRAGQAQPQRGCPTGNITQSFVLQTFGGEKRVVRHYKGTTEMIASNDLIGLNPDAEYESASYQGTQYVSNGGQLLFSGQEVKLVEYIDESEVPGVAGFTFA